MQVIRFILGRIILFLDWVTSPRPVLVSNHRLSEIEKFTSNMIMYEFKACPFCVRVRRFMKRNNINNTTKDARKDKLAAQELIDGGGKLQVPWLAITKDDGSVDWMYESKDIINLFSKELEIN